MNLAKNLAVSLYPPNSLNLRKYNPRYMRPGHWGLYLEPWIRSTCYLLTSHVSHTLDSSRLINIDWNLLRVVICTLTIDTDK